MVKVFDVITEGETGDDVAEYVERTLREILQEGPLERQARHPPPAGRRPRPRARTGVVHRDVKPGGVVRSSRTVKLADLGIATGIDTTRIHHDRRSSAAWPAQLVIESEEVTLATDVYALAAVAFETLSGRKARPASTPAAIVRRWRAILRRPGRGSTSRRRPKPASGARQGMAFDPAGSPDPPVSCSTCWSGRSARRPRIGRAAAAFTDTEGARPPEPLDEEVTPPTAAPEEAPRRREGPERAIAFVVTLSRSRRGWLWASRF